MARYWFLPMARKTDSQLSDAGPKSCNDTIHENGFRFTPQRREVFDALMAKRDHPTAVEVFMRVKERMPSISLATVYNCLETLTECNLVKHVNLDRAPSRYCANLEPHGHFFCTECDAVHDVPLRKKGAARSDRQDLDAPPEFGRHPSRSSSLRGLCPDCAARDNAKPTLKSNKI